MKINVVRIFPEEVTPLSAQPQCERVGRESICIEGLIDEAGLRSIRSALHCIRGVETVSVSAETGLADIGFGPGRVDPKQLHTALRAVGFKSA